MIKQIKNKPHFLAVESKTGKTVQLLNVNTGKSYTMSSKKLILVKAKPGAVISKHALTALNNEYKDRGKTFKKNISKVFEKISIVSLRYDNTLKL